MDHHTIEIPSDILSTDAHRFNSPHAQPLVTSRIAFRIVSKLVRDSVYFDRQSRCLAEEIQNEWSERMLPPELKSTRSKPKHSPEPDL